MQENNVTYVVKEVVQETANVVTLKLVSEGVQSLHKAGQFITVFFPETGHKEGKSYSISSAPFENSLNITVKGVGVFSNKLLSKKVGDTVMASLPYGYFYSESETSPLVIITGGIGIAPLRGMILQSLYLNSNRKIVLFYSNKTRSSIIFKKEFDRLLKQHSKNFIVHYYLTQEDATNEIRSGRIQGVDVVKESSGLSGSEFFICGSIAFVRDYWKALKALGISEETIYTEAFF